MSVGYARGAAFRAGAPATTPPPTDWSRPTDWLPITTPSVGEQKVVALYAVDPAPAINYFSVAVSGAYTIDYGDGQPPVNYTAGSTASKILNWSDYAGTETSEGFRQAVITITMQSGQTFTSLNIQALHPSTLNGYVTGWLDLRMAGASVNTLTLNAGSNARAYRLQHFEFVGPNMITSCNRQFWLLQNLKKISAFSVANATDLGDFANTCTSLVSVPTINAPNATNWSTAFASCYALPSVSVVLGAGAANMNSSFVSCVALTSVSIGGTTSGLSSLNNTFSGCTSLVNAPSFDTQNVTDMTSLFANCTSLRGVPLYNTTKVTSMSSTFSGCRLLRFEDLPLFDTQNVTNMSNMFNSCSSLTTVPLYNTSKVTLMSGMFQACNSLQTIPALDTTQVVNLSNFFWNCPTIQVVPALNVPNCTNFTQAFNAAPAIRSIQLTGARYSIVLATGSPMTAAALDALYTSLGNAIAGQSITVTGTLGVAGDTPSIATAKGWTVIGS